MEHLLSIITFTPMVAALILAIFLRGEDKAAQDNARWVALVATLVTFLVSLFLLFGFDSSNTDFQFVEEHKWIMGLNYKIGVDGISVLFVMLTTFLMPMVIWSTWTHTHRVKEYMIAFLVMETLMLGVFCALDTIVFYLFFEGGLIPMFLIIGIWGGPKRIYAAYKFFLYSFLGSVMMLVAIVAMYVDAGTTDMVKLMAHDFASSDIRLLGFNIPGGLETLLFLAFFCSFAVKLPLFPVHTWLPDAHVQAPTAGSVDLAAILLKMGGYGFLRFALPMFPIASDMFTPMMMVLSVIAVVYASLIALVQEDVKKLIAYSSVGHMGLVCAGIFSGNQQGIDGAIYLMISHGFVSGALFLCVGVVYDRLHTREISAYGGLVNKMPAYALIFMFFTMANIGLPGTSNFVGEFLALAGIFKTSTWFGAIAATGVILSACYGLMLYRRMFTGSLIKESLRSIQDLELRERLIFAPLVAMTLILGFYPSFVTDIVGPSVEKLVQNYETALAENAASTETATH